jgi:hypothetical protein
LAICGINHNYHLEGFVDRIGQQVANRLDREGLVSAKNGNKTIGYKHDGPPRQSEEYVASTVFSLG